MCWSRQWQPTPVLLPGRLQYMGSQRVWHDWATSLSLFTFHFHALEKEMATHSSVLAWRIPGMGEPGGLLSTGLHRVRHDWSGLAAAAAAGLCVTYRRVGSINHIMCLNWAVYILVQNFILSCLLLCLKCVRAVLCKMIISQWINLLHSPSLEMWDDSWPPCTHGVHILYFQSLVDHPVPTSSSWVGHRSPGGGPCWPRGDMSVPCGSACAFDGLNLWLFSLGQILPHSIY